MITVGKVIAVCTSPAKGTQKTSVERAVFIEDYGIEGDAHAGKWHRQGRLFFSFYPMIRSRNSGRRAPRWQMGLLERTW